MEKRRTILLALLALCCLVLTGCKDPEKEKALEKLAEIKFELSDVEDTLAETNKQRDTLKQEIESLSASLKNTKENLSETTQLYNTLKDKLAKLEEENGSLKTTIEDLKINLKSKLEDEVKCELSGIVFASEIDREGLPLDDFRVFFLEKKHFWIFSKWILTVKEHNVTVKLYDSEGKLLREIPRVFTPETTTCNTRHFYTINKYLDKPGKWKVELYLNGNKMGEKNLMVMAETTSDN